eukprot:6207422-Pleurochrysis_carterae.AAC.3
MRALDAIENESNANAELMQLRLLSLAVPSTTYPCFVLELHKESVELRTCPLAALRARACC